MTGSGYRLGWPLAQAAPVAAKSLKKPLKPRHVKPPVPKNTPVPPILSAPVKTDAGPHLEDPPLEASFFPGAAGHLVYTSIFTQHTYLAIHEFNGLSPQQSDNNSTHTALTYLFQRPPAEHFYGDLLDPQFSPDGRYVLFKCGNVTDSQGCYHLYVLDTVTNQLKLVTPRILNYTCVSWSPDGDYIAYVENGDPVGDVYAIHGSAVDYIGPLELYVCNWRTGEEHLVASSDKLRGPFAWLAPHTLLYDALTEQDQKLLQKNEAEAHTDHTADRSAAKKKPSRVPYPNVYAYSLEKHQARLLISEGQSSVCSPNGQWIAFVGLANPQQLASESLFVAKRDGSSRVAFMPVPETYLGVQWLPNSSHFLTLVENKAGLETETKVTEWDLKTHSLHPIVTLHAKDFKSFESSPYAPVFAPLSISPDGRQFVLFRRQVIGEMKDKYLGSYYVIEKTLQSINLKDGTITTMAQIKNANGVDWSAAPPPAH